MQDFCSENTAEIKLGGIKLSPELVLFNLYRLPIHGQDHFSLLRRIAEDRINLTFLLHHQTKTGMACSFCVIRNDAVRVKRCIQSPGSSGEEIGIIDPVGTIAIFPHRYSLAVLGTLIRITARARIPIHALCTSLSSVAVTTDYRYLGKVVEEVQKVFSLPVNHAPFRSDFEQEQVGG